MSDVQPTGALLDVRDLEVVFTRGPARRPRRRRRLVHRGPGETVGLVGESGSGKSVTSLAVMGLLPDRGVRVGGQVWFDGDDLLTLPKDRMRDIRGKTSPWSSRPDVLAQPGRADRHPGHRGLTRHQGLKGDEAKDAAADLLTALASPDPNRRLKEYPHQLSGGMRQRA